MNSQLPNALTCNDASVIQAVGIISFCIMIIKIVVPVLLILVTVKDMVNAILAQDDGEIKKLAGVFIKKFVIAVFIFFIPTIINVIFGYVGPYINNKSNYVKCVDCLTDYSKC